MATAALNATPAEDACTTATALLIWTNSMQNCNPRRLIWRPLVMLQLASADHRCTLSDRYDCQYQCCMLRRLMHPCSFVSPSRTQADANCCDAQSQQHACSSSLVTSKMKDVLQRPPQRLCILCRKEDVIRQKKTDISLSTRSSWALAIGGVGGGCFRSQTHTYDDDSHPCCRYVNKPLSHKAMS